MRKTDGLAPVPQLSKPDYYTLNSALWSGKPIDWQIFPHGDRLRAAMRQLAVNLVAIVADEHDQLLDKVEALQPDTATMRQEISVLHAQLSGLREEHRKSIQSVQLIRKLASQSGQLTVRRKRLIASLRAKQEEITILTEICAALTDPRAENTGESSS